MEVQRKVEDKQSRCFDPSCSHIPPEQSLECAFTPPASMGAIAAFERINLVESLESISSFLVPRPSVQSRPRLTRRHEDRK